MSRKRGSWFSVENNFASHPKFIGLSLDAIGLWLKLMGYCAMHHTDGFIPNDAIRLAVGGRSRVAIDPLLDRNVIKLDPSLGGVWIENYLDYQTSRSQYEANLERNREKLNSYRRNNIEKRSSCNALVTSPEGTHSLLLDSEEIQNQKRRDSELKDLSSQLRTIPPEPSGQNSLPAAPARPVPGSQAELPIGNVDCGDEAAPSCDDTQLSAPDGLHAPKEPRKGQRKPRTPKAPKPEPEGHALVVRTYFEAFEAARRAKPVFGGREGKAIGRLIESTGSPERACEVIRNAYADQWHAPKATIMTIAADPAKHLGERVPMSSSGMWPRRIIQQDDSYANQDDPGGWNAVLPMTKGASGG